MGKVYSSNKLMILKKREAETWIYSYADLITNLLALFVMLLILATGSNSKQKDFIRGVESYVSGKSYATGRLGSGQSDLDNFKQIVSEMIQKSELSGQVSLNTRKGGIEMTFEGAVVFASGTAVLNEEGSKIIGEIADIVKELPAKYIIVVEGHTDSRPVVSGLFPSNWELSSARAGSIVRFLEARGVNSSRMQALGLSDTRPLDHNADSPRNRRVVIRIDVERTKGEK